MTDCMESTGGRKGKGYASVWYGGKHITAHRAAWMEANGPIPDGMFVLHHCDNRKCVNPKHLFLGTNADNMADMCAKGRQARWDRKSSTKLDPDKVCTLVTLVQVGNSRRSVAKLFGVTHSVVNDICNGKKWKGVA